MVLVLFVLDIIKNYNDSWNYLDGPKESHGTEASRTQGKARLGIERLSLAHTPPTKITAPWSRGSHSQLSREI